MAKYGRNICIVNFVNFPRYGWLRCIKGLVILLAINILLTSDGRIAIMDQLVDSLLFILYNPLVAWLHGLVLALFHWDLVVIWRCLLIQLRLERAISD